MMYCALRDEVLKIELEIIERIPIDQVPKLNLAHQLSKLRRINQQRLGAALGKWRIAFIHEVCDIEEENGRREWGRSMGNNGNYTHFLAADIR